MRASLSRIISKNPWNPTRHFYRPAKLPVGLVPVLVPSALLVVWLIGLMLDKMQFMQAYQEEQNRRNEMLSAVHSAATKQKGNDDSAAS